MFLFMLLALVIAALVAVVLVITGVVGTITIAVFGDIIVFVAIIMLIVKLFRKKK